MLYQFFKLGAIGMLLILTFLTFSTNTYAQERYKTDLKNRRTQNQLKRISTILPFHKIAQTVTVEIDEGRAFLEGDIAINQTSPINNLIQGAVAIASNNYRWDEGIIPYTIQNNHPERNTILKAIEYLSNNTNICMVPRGGERDYVQFVRYNLGCWSYVGRQGGMQEINIGNCDFGAIVHEICHAVGLFHEQSRSDRDNYITVNWNNIDPTQQQNFEKHVSMGIDIGAYDYYSIMHYPAWAFSYTGGETISCQGGTCPSSMGQRNQLSSGDLQGIKYLYSNAIGCGNSPPVTKPTTNPNPPVTKPKPTTKPKPPITPPDRNIVVAVTNALGDNQCSEIIQLSIGGANTQMDLSLSSKQKTIEFVFLEPGWYTYSINAQTTFYKSFWGWNYTYNRNGTGQGKIYVDSDKKYYLAMKASNNDRGNYVAYLQEH
ncbi:MAG: M12 family metallopeptidase [Chitinophagales bacterium]